MVIKLRVLQFWSEIILVISNQTRAGRSLDFEITRMISDQVALHSVQLPIYITLPLRAVLSFRLLRYSFAQLYFFYFYVTDARSCIFSIFTLLIRAVVSFPFLRYHCVQFLSPSLLRY